MIKDIINFIIKKINKTSQCKVINVESEELNQSIHFEIWDKAYKKSRLMLFPNIPRIYYHDIDTDDKCVIYLFDEGPKVLFKDKYKLFRNSHNEIVLFNMLMSRKDLFYAYWNTSYDYMNTSDLYRILSFIYIHGVGETQAILYNELQKIYYSTDFDYSNFDRYELSKITDSIYDMVTREIENKKFEQDIRKEVNN